MKLHSNSRRVLFRELQEGSYGLKQIPQNSVPNMIDIGANVGLISIMARLLHPKMDIIAIEPHQKTFQELVDNVDHLKIKTFNCALGNGDKFYLTKQRKMDLCNKFSTKDDVIKESQSIDSMKIQDIFFKFKKKPEDTLLKMDCEGGEFYMVGDKESESLIKKVRIIAMEAHNKNEMGLEPFVEWFMRTLWQTHIIIIDKQNSNLAQLMAVEKSFNRQCGGVYYD